MTNKITCLFIWSTVSIYQDIFHQIFWHIFFFFWKDLWIDLSLSLECYLLKEKFDTARGIENVCHFTCSYAKLCLTVVALPYENMNFGNKYVKPSFSWKMLGYKSNTCSLLYQILDISIIYHFEAHTKWIKKITFWGLPVVYCH